MINGKNILAIIPARMGSKRFKMKNIRFFKGKPLFIWAILAAQSSKYIDDVFLTTESDKIKKIAKKYGYFNDYLRSPKLADDKTHPNEMLLDLFKNLKKKYEYFILLQATSPLRYKYDIDCCIKKIERGSYDTLTSIHESNSEIKPNGAIYINKTESFLKYKKIVRNKNAFFYRMPKFKSIDIDRSKDFEKALRN
jgi:CMP-N-acetylneuraminic acid synthetase